MKSSRRTVLGGLAAAGAVAAASQWVRPGTRSPRKGQPNILLLMPDQLRSSATSHLNPAAPPTPAMDALAAAGSSFTHTFCTSPVCAPSRASILSGLYPTAVGVHSNDDALPTDTVTLAEQLRTLGYATGYIGKWHLAGDLGAEPGFVPPGPQRQGFADYWAAYNQGHHFTRYAYHRDTSKIERPAPLDRFEPLHQVDQAIEFVSTHRERPFFLMVSFGPPHAPHLAPPAYWDRIDPATIPIPGNVPDWMVPPNRGPKGRRKALDPGAREYLHGYLASIQCIDDCVDRIVAHLADLAISDHTLVVLTSDHGEMGGSHGAYMKGRPYDEATRVPLTITCPGWVRPGQHDALVSGVDLAPTLLDLVGMPSLVSGDSRPQSPPPWPTHGHTLTPWLRGDMGFRRQELLVQGRLAYTGRHPADLTSWRMIRTPVWQYSENIRGRDRKLFHMASDPEQKHNLVDDGSRQDIVAQMKTRLMTLREAVE